jgi:hypothetical protein
MGREMAMAVLVVLKAAAREQRESESGPEKKIMKKKKAVEVLAVAAMASSWLFSRQCHWRNVLEKRHR